MRCRPYFTYFYSIHTPHAPNWQLCSTFTHYIEAVLSLGYFFCLFFALSVCFAYLGNTYFQVIHSAFSSDNRWLSISTNHGTTHLYAITPYGGPICARTHCDKFVNKETKFERSAGFTSAHQLAVAAKNAQYHGGSARSLSNRNPAQPQKNNSSFR